MDFGKAFTFVFDDPDWLSKVAINALIGLIPFVGQIYLLGWGLEVARRIVMQSGTPLPETDFGTYLGHGFKALVVSLVFSLPIFVLVIPIVLVAAVVEGANLDNDAVYAILTLVNVVFGLLMAAYGVLMGFALPAAMTRAVVFGSIGDGLNLREVFALIRAAPGAYLLTMLGSIAAGLLAGIVGSLACGVGLIFTAAIQQAVNGHFYGQAYRQAAAATG